MIIVVTVCPGSLFRFLWRGLSMEQCLWESGKAPQKAAGLSHFPTGTTEINFYFNNLKK